MKKIEDAPHVKDMKIARAHTCEAKARTNQHKPCQQPAMKNGRCRLHGGKSTGAKTEAGKLKAGQANYKHGLYTKAARLERLRWRHLMSWKDDLDEFVSN